MNDGATCTVLLPNSAYIHQRKLKLLLSLKEGSQRGSRGFPGGSVGKESACNARDPSSIPGLERSAGKGIGYPVQYSGLEIPMDCIVHYSPWGHKESDMTE